MKELKLDEQDLKKVFIVETPKVKFLRFLRKLTLNLIYFAFLFGIFFVGLNFPAFWQRFNFEISPPVAVAPTPPPPPVAKVIPDYAPELTIPRLGVKAPLLIDVSPELIVEKLKKGVTHYLDTAYPGEIGNSVIVGHSSDFPWNEGKYKNIFALLDKLVIGDEIIVAYKKQKLTYKVTGSKVVAPTDLTVLKKTNQPILTLLTCYPVGTTRSRLIITAKLSKGEITGTQQGEPGINAALPRPR